jgi:hypothetical protein
MKKRPSSIPGRPFSMSLFPFGIPSPNPDILPLIFQAGSALISGRLTLVNPLHLLSSKKLPCFFVLIVLFFAHRGGVAAASPELQVPPCARISLTASYLAELKPGTGPTYHFRLSNETEHAIVLARPVPSSAHWFTRDGEHWYWRSSAGGGGSLVDAMAPNGKMFVYRATQALASDKILKVAPHSTMEWEEGAKDNPALEFKPSCSICNHPSDREFRAIFAYAYLPLPQDKTLGLLPCGIRSSPVDVPPIR